MLVYVDVEADEDFAEYNDRYRDHPCAFPIDPGNALFATDLIRETASRPDLSILEIGCGQGHFLSGIVDVAMFLRGNEPVRALGVDGASVAIRQAAERDPRINWAADRLQRFVTRHDQRVGPYRYDLIVDRGGNTVVSGPEDAAQLLNSLGHLMKPNGVYTYLISKTWYHRTSSSSIVIERSFNRDWEEDWITLARQRFGYCSDHSTPAHYQICFSGAPLAETPQRG